MQGLDEQPCSIPGQPSLDLPIKAILFCVDAIVDENISPIADNPK